jgi:hypothetical protein
MKMTPEAKKAVAAFSEWMILNREGKRERIASDQKYLLKNAVNDHFLRWEKQTWGINLGFNSTGDANDARNVLHWNFVTRDGSVARYGQPVALFCKVNYIRHEKRNVGVNLGWSRRPVFQWVLLGGSVGRGVRTGEWLVIWNTAIGEPLIRFKRDLGTYLGWPSSKRWAETLGKTAKETLQKEARELVKSQTG